MKTELLVSCIVAAAAIPGTALAQTTPENQKTDIGRVNASGAAGDGAASADNTPSATGVTRKELGGGLMVDENVSKAKSSVTRDFIQKQQPSSDVFQLLKFSPGANSAAGDAWGLNQGIIAVRGLEGGQLGFNFEGMPLSVASNWSVFPGQWIDTENTDVVTLNQGSADISSPNVNATGGNVDLFLHTPSKQRGGLIGLSYGSDNARRIFIRGETGNSADGTARAFVSWSHMDADHFRGPGKDTKDIFSFGGVKDWGQGSRTKIAMTYTEVMRDTYKNPTKAQWNASGVDGDQSNYSNNYATGGTNYYGLLKNPWRNLLLSAPSDFKINDALSINVTPYVFYGYGASGAGSVLNESSVGMGNTLSAVDLNGNGTTTDRNVLVYSPIFEDNTRMGATTKATYTIANHTLVGGLWYQYSRDQLYRRYAQASTDGTPMDETGEEFLIRDASGTVVRTWDQDTRDDFRAVFFGDTINFMDDRLAFDIGGKQLWLTREGINRVPNAVGRTEASHNPFLPTGAVRFKFNDQHMVFVSIAKGYRLLPAGALYPRYSATTAALSTRANPDQPSETSTGGELGYRYQGKIFSLSTSVFHYDFKNRQISAVACDGNACISQPINGGKQRAQGLDFEAGLRPYKNFRPYVSFELLSTKLQSDIPVSGDYLPTTGKSAVRAPKFTGAIAVDYDNGTLFGNFGFKHVGSQYATFMNDEKMPSYNTFDAAIGYRFAGNDTFKKPEVRLNLLNLTNKKYLSGIYSPTTNATATRGTNGTTVAASAPSYLIGNTFSAMVTVATAF
ncbi:TonB-dependent receptor [Uliginosibacterium sediminicola]|uniref:TonB-dependent receptor n=1 Tax=Uliginosibacterium sediminicola TaxID=2024550 RepID=A0ABU9Z239_9RHOO